MLNESAARSPNLVTQTAIYVTASGVATAIPVLLAPILTFYLNPEDYGVLIVFDLAMKLVSPMVGLGTQVAVRRKYFDVDETDLSLYVSTALAALGGIRQKLNGD